MNEWRQRAACRDHVELFDMTFDMTRRPHARALEVCGVCPVRRDCLEDALAIEAVVPGRYGLLGGLMPRERARLDRYGAEPGLASGPNR